MVFTTISETETRGSYITFRDVGATPSGKTRRFEVRDLQGGVLGWVYWYPGWRKYIYHPKPGTLYEEVCMTEIAEFIKMKTATHKGKR